MTLRALLTGGNLDSVRHSGLRHRRHGAFHGSLQFRLLQTRFLISVVNVIIAVVLIVTAFIVIVVITDIAFIVDIVNVADEHARFDGRSSRGETVLAQR